MMNKSFVRESFIDPQSRRLSVFLSENAPQLVDQHFEFSNSSKDLKIPSKVGERAISASTKIYESKVVI